MKYKIIKKCQICEKKLFDFLNLGKQPLCDDLTKKPNNSKFYKLPNNIILVGSYHPSPRNVNTGRIDIKKMTNLFLKIKKAI